MSDRYYMIAAAGYEERGKYSRASFAVLDSAWCHREVASFYVDPRASARTDQYRLRLAQRECDRLNNIDLASVGS